MIPQIELRDRILVSEAKKEAVKRKVPLQGVGVFFNLNNPDEVLGVYPNLVVRDGREVPP